MLCDCTPTVRVSLAPRQSQSARYAGTGSACPELGGRRGARMCEGTVERAMLFSPPQHLQGEDDAAIAKKMEETVKTL